MHRADSIGSFPAGILGGDTWPTQPRFYLVERIEAAFYIKALAGFDALSDFRCEDPLKNFDAPNVNFRLPFGLCSVKVMIVNPSVQ
jgi:hypothetical protein